MSRLKGRLTLPDNPSLEQLREQAKERLAIIRTHAPEAQLSDAQFALARDYGFPGWRALKAEVDRRGGAVNGLVGYYADPAISNNALSVTARGERVFYQLGTGATVELIRQPDGAFATPGLTRRYRFERDANGKARTLIIETETGGMARAARISAEKAAQMRAERDQAAKAEWRARAAIEITEDALERCVGYYANPLGQVLQFTQEGRRLFMETADQRRIPLDAETQTDFFLALARMEVHFHIEGAVATSVVSGCLGAEAILSRVSAEVAASLNAIVAARAVEQAQPRPVEVPVRADILARYAGRYRIENGMVMSVTVDSGRIFAQMLMLPVTQPKQEIFPESDSKFFWTTRAAQISFVADADGKVDYGVLHQSGHLVPISRMEEQPATVAPAA